MDGVKLKWLVLLGSTIGIVWTSVLLWDRFWQPAGKLSAVAVFSEASYSPSLLQALAAPREVIASEEFEKAAIGSFRPVGLSDEQWAQVTSHVARHLRVYLFEKLPLSKDPELLYRGTWKITVTNSGTKAISKARLSIPGADLVLLRGQTSKDEIVELGDLPPQDTVIVEAWDVSNPPVNRRPTLVHENGVGKLVFEGSSRIVWSLTH